MKKQSTTNLLPEVYKTKLNRQFLAATVDQLTAEPEFEKSQGYVGRKVGPGVNPSQGYIQEPTADRSNYQFEPGVAMLKPDTTDVDDIITYPGFVDSIELEGGDVTKQDRLWNNEFYSWDPFVDFDKFSNYSQYYWLPTGPDSVSVSSTDVLTAADYTVTRNATNYTFSTVPGTNPILTLVRGGTYNFEVTQNGNGFFIQTNPGTTGVIPSTPNISSRDVLGVTNNGSQNGTVSFNVPLTNAQDFFYNLNQIDPVDLATDTIKFNQLNNVYVEDFLNANPNGIDGITDLDGRTVVFTNTIEDTVQGGWQITTRFDSITSNGSGAFDTQEFDQVTDIITKAERYSVWQVNYRTDTDGRSFMVLESIRSVDEDDKFLITFGTVNSSRTYYKNSNLQLEQQPLLTAVLGTLYYQDSENAALFGEIRLVNADEAVSIDVNDIIGAQNYTSPNGVAFTNGLKVQFRGTTVPASYSNVEYYVEGVGSGPGLDNRVGFVDGQAYYGPSHTHMGQLMTGASHTVDTFHQNIYTTVQDSVANMGAGGPADAIKAGIAIPEQLDGNGIVLIPVTDFVTPEKYTTSKLIPFDSTGYDAESFDSSLNAPTVQDYITINRASQAKNSWSRSNRWFHIDVINATATYNKTTALVDQDDRAKRPILEFRADLKLFNSGTQAQTPVNVIDFTETDALSNVNGQTGYGSDGYEYVQGSLVIFAADIDPQVRNKIYTVNFVDFDNIGTNVINLVPLAGGTVLANQQVLNINGVNQQGLTYSFNGTSWSLTQAKTKVNQPPLYDVFDINGISYGDTTTYSGSTFTGNQLFGYKDSGTTTLDNELGISLTYQTINNIGDIVFENFFYTKNFVYVSDRTSITTNVGTGFVHQYVDRVSYADCIGWQTAIQDSRQRQIFNFIYDNTNPTLILDVPADTTTLVNPIKVFIDGNYTNNSNFTYAISGQNTTITLSSSVVPKDGIPVEVQVLSNSASSVGYYEVPSNLESNPINVNSDTFTLGSVRGHYDSIAQNIPDLTGKINGQNNTRDLGNISRYGDMIIQSSAPLTLGGVFLRDTNYEVYDSILYNSQEYEKYKAALMDQAGKGDYLNNTATQILDLSIDEITLGKNSNTSFYWSDMLPNGSNYTEITYTVNSTSTTVYDTNVIYNFTSSNFAGLLIYLNGTILVKDTDYTVPANTATINISKATVVGDVITIREYTSTAGSYVPNTPTKMGMYPAYVPSKYVDSTYLTPQTVIRGHDGSITIAYGDIRDDVLLEFETRIYNNIKVTGTIPIVAADVIPGEFRTTDYTATEINQILSPDFLGWTGTNKIEYQLQQYDQTNPFTWNYSGSSNKLDGSALLGAWRGIYLNFYDTITPHTTPWEMLGLSKKPTWWESEYGPAPYTSGNLVLWQNLELGYIADPANPRYDTRYTRLGLTDAIPVDSEGNLLAPNESVMGTPDASTFRRGWRFGDDGPTENVWRSSSSWPFALMRLIALANPAKFFGLFADLDLYKYSTTIEQYLWNKRARLDAKNIDPLYGNGTSKASYINWIIDYNRKNGVNSTTSLTNTLSNVDVRLGWRLASFSDKRYLKVYTERSTPDSTNAGLLLPDESYKLLVYKNVPTKEVTYSSVIIQSTAGGWAVLGYDQTKGYFNILQSRTNGPTITVEGGSETVQAAIEFTDQVVSVPYGYVYTNPSSVVDFLRSYGKFLETRGLTFVNQENGFTLTWDAMASEFLYWTGQGFAEGSVINLNPLASKISIAQDGLVADSLVPRNRKSTILNQNKKIIPLSDLIIDRDQGRITLETRTTDAICYVNFKFTAYEHIMIVDNKSVFGDLIYQPTTGNRQNRIQINGFLSSNWNGTLDAPGFVLNQDNIIEWNNSTKYTKGDIVLFKGKYYVAKQIVNPAEKFNFSLWTESDYDLIQKGLLPNAANSSNELQTAYSIYNANLETETDLFSYGLIGFRPRDYMTNLNLDDISQVNLYSQFLGSKGTNSATELFSLADLGKEAAEYDVYELWKVLKSEYGANFNRRYIDIQINEANISSSPALIEVITPGEISVADQTIAFNELYKTSYPVTSPNIFTELTQTVTDTALPGAGYVNTADVDTTAFDFDSANTAILAKLDQLGQGSTLWVAAVNEYNWNVYRLETIDNLVVRTFNNLNGQLSIAFAGYHNLKIGDRFVVKDFNNVINGLHQVDVVVDANTVTIDTPLSAENISADITGSGLGLKLVSTRVAQPSDIANLDFAKDLRKGILVWVDNNVDGKWEVLEKTEPFVQSTTLQLQFPTELSEFGSVVSQGLLNETAFIGAPNYNPNNTATDPGILYTYVRTQDNAYSFANQITLNATGTSKFGASADVGNSEWTIAGAPESDTNSGYAATIFTAASSNAPVIKQVLVSPDQNFGEGKFGQSVLMALDENWMFIGSPGANRVHAFAKETVALQTITYTTTENQFNYNWSNYIKVDTGATDIYQMVVVLNNIEQIPNVDYTITASDIVFQNVTADQKLIITRRVSVQLDQFRSNKIIGTNTVGTGDGAKFLVSNVRGVYTVEVTSAGTGYAVNDLITIAQADIDTVDSTPPAAIVTPYTSHGGTALVVGSTTGIVAGMTIAGNGFVSGQTVVSVDGATQITTSAAPSITPTGNLTFSHDLKILVTSVNDTTGVVGFTASGSGISTEITFPLDQYFAQIGDIYSFTVKVDDKIQRPHIDYEFNSDSATLLNELEFLTVPAAGSTIMIDAGTYWNYSETIAPSGLDVGDNFGHSLTASTDGSVLVVGLPYSSTNKGSAYVYSRNSQKFIVTTAGANQSFTTISSMTAPGIVNVSVNDVALTNQNLNTGNGYTLNTATQTATISQTLQIGDIVEIGTNQFTLIETILGKNTTIKSEFGYSLDHCRTNCSLYVGARMDSTTEEQSGAVEYWANQMNTYSTATSKFSNPAFTIGDYISINGYYVQLTGTTITQLIADITAATIPNLVVSATADTTLSGDGTTTVFGVGNIYSDASGYNTVVLVNDVEQTAGVAYTYDNSTKQITFSIAPINNAVIKVVSGRITFTLTDLAITNNLDNLSVLPGTGTAFADLDIDLYVWQQTIKAPNPQPYSQFGFDISVDTETNTLIVGAPDGNLILPNTFDSNKTLFDDNSTRFDTTIVQSGVVYQFDSLAPYKATVSNPYQFVFGQQFTPENIESLDKYGYSVDYRGSTLLVGVPKSDRDDSSSANFGVVLQFINADKKPAWNQKRIQSPTVDISLFNTVSMYNFVNNTTDVYLDYFDPLQGKMLGVISENIDYIGGIDPASYNNGQYNNNGMRWAEAQVGQLWWDTSVLRYIDPNQNDPVYSSKKWGTLFPGSIARVYSWVISNDTPTNWTGSGVPHSLTSYVSVDQVNQSGFIETVYYFWVSSVTAVNKDASKTLSASSLESYILSPSSSGIAYLAPINNSTIAIYNTQQYLNAQDTILHIEFDKEETSNRVHVEYELITQDKADSFLDARLYTKFVDSLSGSTAAGQAVPDPLLPEAEKYGIQIRPRQSMFKNRFTALQNYIVASNRILKTMPISETKSFALLNSKEPEPNASAYDKRLLTYEELGYQNINNVALGYKYLVATDETNSNLWTIYTVQLVTGSTIQRETSLTRVQNFDTTNFWSYIDWYRIGYTTTTRIIAEVQNYSNLASLDVAEGSSAKVLANSDGKWEIYLLEDSVWNRVGLEDGTIAISSSIYDYSTSRFGFDAEVFDAQYFDQAPITETRKIIDALNTQLFTGDLLIQRNKLLITMFNYVFSEQTSPDWLDKTSLVDVDHVIRELIPYKTYRQDDQDFVLNYIKEVKPYHVQIREFNLQYQGIDSFLGSLADFDLPAEYDTTELMFVSPVLDNTAGGSLSTTSSRPSSNTVWTEFPYNQWFNNYKLSLTSITLAEAGSGYSSVPTVTISGDATTDATATAIINSAGQVTGITVLTEGSGYITTPTVTISSSSGSGAIGVPVLTNNMVRNVDVSVKYDRYQYTSNITDWVSGTIYAVNDRVRYLNKVYNCITATSASTFILEQWTLIPASDLNGIDRTQGYYAPTVDMPGRDLSLVISGLDYPGVQVEGLNFSSNTGFDVSAFDSTPFDNIIFDELGNPSYDPSILDVEYQSQFTDSYLGTRATDINVQSNGFVDTYSSYAPEELIPGANFDTLDFRVHTSPGADWEGNGHGFPTKEVNALLSGGLVVVSWDGLLDEVFHLEVYNQTSQSNLQLGTDYTINWIDRLITLQGSASANGDVIKIIVYGLGGANQLYLDTTTGDLTGSGLLVPVGNNVITSVAVFVNGVPTTAYSVVAVTTTTSRIDFDTVYTATDRITVAVLGTPLTAGQSWSTPQTQDLISDGSLSITLTNSMMGTNSANAIVNVDGRRARPSESIRYTGDGSTTGFQIPQGDNYDLQLVSQNDVSVWVDNTELVAGVGFTLEPQTEFTNDADFGLVTGAVTASEDLGSVASSVSVSIDLGLVSQPAAENRLVILTTAPTANSTVLISVRTKAQYWITDQQLVFQPSQGLFPVTGEKISITSFNDTSEQSLYTQIFVGPNQTGVTVSVAFDATGYDSGSFDESTGLVVYNNGFNTGVTLTNAIRLVVTLNGRYLFANEGFTTDGTNVIISGPTISTNDVVVIETFTQETVQEEIGFRIFQDMRQLQQMYRIIEETNTELTNPCTALDDIIYVADASKLPQPDPANGIFGLVTINGERIAYRERDTTLNTISGVRRGTAGTGAATHTRLDKVISIGTGNKLPVAYQNKFDKQKFTGDGTTIDFVTTDISIVGSDSTEVDGAVIVFVGGTQLKPTEFQVTTANPVGVRLDATQDDSSVLSQPPGVGVEVVVGVDKGQTMYKNGGSTPSNGVPLQYTNTQAARFIRNA